jgi:hypothetical protein
VSEGVGAEEWVIRVKYEGWGAGDKAGSEFYEVAGELYGKSLLKIAGRAERY